MHERSQTLKPIRVLLLVRGPLFRESLANVLVSGQCEVSARQAETIEEGLFEVRNQIPAVIVFQNSPPELDPFSFLRQLAEEFGADAPPAIVLKRGLDIEIIARLLALGAKGCLSPDSLSWERLLSVLPVVARGYTVVGPEVASVLGDNLSTVPPLSDAAVAPAGLTPREKEVLQLVADGFLNKEIAARLEIGARTVEMHVARLASKLGAKSRAEVMIRALQLADST